jgi:hypothetical protein
VINNKGIGLLVVSLIVLVGGPDLVQALGGEDAIVDLVNRLVMFVLTVTAIFFRTRRDETKSVSRGTALVLLAIGGLAAGPALAGSGPVGGKLGRPQSPAGVMGDAEGYTTLHLIFGAGIALEDFLAQSQNEPMGAVRVAYETPDGYYTGPAVLGAGQDSTAAFLGLDLGYRFLGETTSRAALYAGGEVFPVGLHAGAKMGPQGRIPYGTWVFCRYQIGPWHDVRPRITWHPGGGFAYQLEFAIISSKP